MTWRWPWQRDWPAPAADPDPGTPIAAVVKRLHMAGATWQRIVLAIEAIEILAPAPAATRALASERNAERNEQRYADRDAEKRRRRNALRQKRWRKRRKIKARLNGGVNMSERRGI